MQLSIQISICNLEDWWTLPAKINLTGMEFGYYKSICPQIIKKYGQLQIPAADREIVLTCGWWRPPIGRRTRRPRRAVWGGHAVWRVAGGMAQHSPRMHVAPWFSWAEHRAESMPVMAALVVDVPLPRSLPSCSVRLAVIVHSAAWPGDDIRWSRPQAQVVLWSYVMIPPGTRPLAGSLVPLAASLELQVL
jgi:hypothetical protein